jgi:hypothetical protein
MPSISGVRAAWFGSRSRLRSGWLPARAIKNAHGKLKYMRACFSGMKLFPPESNEFEMPQFGISSG